MANFQASTRKLEAVVTSSINADESSINIGFKDGRGSDLTVVFSIQVVPALIALLAARLDDAVGHIDHEKRPEMQTLQLAGIDWAMNEAGQIALLLGLQGGGNLPIQVRRELLPTLKTMMDEALEATDRSKRN